MIGLAVMWYEVTVILIFWPSLAKQAIQKAPHWKFCVYPFELSLWSILYSGVYTDALLPSVADPQQTTMLKCGSGNFVWAEPHGHAI